MKPGDKIALYKIKHTEDADGGRPAKVLKRTWTVLGVYPNFVLCANDKGTRECFTYWHIRKHSRPPVKKVAPNGRVTLMFV